MALEKYGFVYLWRDAKRNRYYLGCHWGRINDGYICSSHWMKQNYKKNLVHFKRRILALVYTNKKDLLEEEFRWLSMIKKEELGSKYYNKHNRHFAHWANNPDNLLTIGQKISKATKGKKAWNQGVPMAEKSKEKLRQTNLGVKQPKVGETVKNLWANEQYRERMTRAHSGKKQSAETIAKRMTKINELNKNSIKNQIKEMFVTMNLDRKEMTALIAQRFSLPFRNADEYFRRYRTKYLVT